MCCLGKVSDSNHQPRSGGDLSKPTSACHDTRTLPNPLLPAPALPDSQHHQHHHHHHHHTSHSLNSTPLERSAVGWLATWRVGHTQPHRWQAQHHHTACQVPAQHDRCLILPPRIRPILSWSTWLQHSDLTPALTSSIGPPNPATTVLFLSSSTDAQRSEVVGNGKFKKRQAGRRV